MGIFNFKNEGKKVNANNMVIPAKEKSWIRKIIDGLIGKKEQHREINNYNFVIEGKNVFLNDLELFQHKDGTISQIKEARILGKQIGNSLEPQKHIVFDVPQGYSIDESFVENMMATYNSYGDNEIIAQYLGEYSQYDNSFHGNDRDEAAYVYGEVLPNIIQEHQDRARATTRVTSLTPEEAFRNKYGFDGEERNARMRYEKNERLENPFLGGDSEKLNGVNINDGNILRIRRLNKVGKDENGVYLYTSYIDSVFKQDEPEVLNPNQEALGKYVCFATNRRVEDIVKKQNPEEIRSLLQLLSLENNMNHQPNGCLNFIGSLYNGNISRDINNVSANIRDKVEEMQKEYLKSHDNQRGYND